MLSPTPPLKTLNDVIVFDFKGMDAGDRFLVPMESGKNVPFPIQRVFTINAHREGLVGGRHSHRMCSQLIVCLHGECDVVCKADGEDDSVTIRLDRPNKAVLLPPSIWGEQIYRRDDTVLMVLCDQGYNETDYIRSFDDHIDHRRSLAN